MDEYGFEGPDSFPGSDEGSHFMAHETSRIGKGYLYESPPEVESLKKWIAEKEGLFCCPFCKHDEPKVDISDRSFKAEYQVQCPHCGAHGPQCKTKAEAAGAWNDIAEVISHTSLGSRTE